ncbi:hypothetical protein VP142E351_P0071 [Vibrio phage 142E35-1]|nr:hypothetical protein VP142E351_P0071 [Vibrio phage 142E35-1]
MPAIPGTRPWFHHSSFIIHHSSFIIHHSSFIIHHYHHHHYHHHQWYRGLVSYQSNDMQNPRHPFFYVELIFVAFSTMNGTVPIVILQVDFYRDSPHNELGLNDFRSYEKCLKKLGTIHRRRL